MSDDAEELRSATRADVEQTLSFALRYDGRKRRQRLFAAQMECG